jgi:hypothetical protein
MVGANHLLHMQWQQPNNTYRDPFALMAINGSSSSQSVANPKSDNLAVRELSSIILLGFMFP